MRHIDADEVHAIPITPVTSPTSPKSSPTAPSSRWKARGCRSHRAWLGLEIDRSPLVVGAAQQEQTGARRSRQVGAAVE